MNRPMQVLIVDDDPATAGLLEETLLSVGDPKRVTVASDGRRALDLLQSGLKPDLVLLDLKMPEVSGHEVLQSLKGNPAFAHVPVIVLTASDDPTDIERCYDLRANSFVVKPDTLEGMRELACAIDSFWFQTNLGASR
jgi:CheY-like chemotaxis protein